MRETDMEYYSAVESPATLLNSEANYACWCNPGTYSSFLIGFETHSPGGDAFISHTLKPHQKPLATEVMRPNGEATASVLLNGQGVPIHNSYVVASVSAAVSFGLKLPFAMGSIKCRDSWLVKEMRISDCLMLSTTGTSILLQDLGNLKEMSERTQETEQKGEWYGMSTWYVTWLLQSLLHSTCDGLHNVYVRLDLPTSCRGRGRCSWRPTIPGEFICS